MSTVSYKQLKGQLDRYGPALLIATVVAWHGIHNWLWLTQNVVLYGWDKARHTAQSLAYNSMMTPLSLRSFFGVFVSDTVRPPMGPLSAVPMYRLFGISGDVAAMVNIVYLVAILVAIWRLGVVLGGRKLGAMSVILVALLPMFYAMPRYFLLEFPLMAFVAVTIWLLLDSNGFEKRGMTLFFGLCLGLGLLTKRTYLAFVFAPVLLVLLRSRVLPSLWQRFRGGVRIDLKDAALALGVGVALSAVWVVPNWTTVQGLMLGGWLFPLWAVLVASFVYLVRRPQGPDTNFLAALALGVTLGSLWYLANPSFLQRMLLFAYGVNDPRGRTLDLGSLSTYSYYLVVLVNQHISLIFSAILVSAAGALSIVLLRKRRFFSTLRRIGTGWWAIVLWIVGPYLVLTLSIYHETRAITPVLPAVALLGSAVLLKLPWKKVRALLFVVLVLIGIVQFYAVSFGPLHRLVMVTELRLPLLGETSLLGRGLYLQLPDSGGTDRRYWIEPDVLQRMEQERLAQQWDNASLGLLVNTQQINFEHFAYLLTAGGYHPRLAVERLARAHGGEPVYPRLFRQDYLLVKRINVPADADSQAVIDLILDDPPDLFLQAFELDASYPLPDGDTVYLYRRRARPPGGFTSDFFPDLAQTLSAMIRSTDAVVVIPPELLSLLGQHGEGRLNVYALPGEEPTEEALVEIAASHDRIWAIFGEGDGNALDEAGRRWLNEYGHRAWDAWFGPTQLVAYGISRDSGAVALQPAGADLGGQVTLEGYLLPEESAEPGEILNLTLLWQARAEMDTDYKVFVHLVDESGLPIAQRDSEPLGGSRPTTTWRPGETVTDRVGLLLPPEMVPGDYEMLVGMYDPETLERLSVFDASGQRIGDSISLGSVQLLPASQVPNRWLQTVQVLGGASPSRMGTPSTSMESAGPLAACALRLARSAPNPLTRLCGRF